MDKSTRQVRMAYWKSVIEQCNSRPAGQSARSWLQENGIPDKQYYYWQRIIRREAFEEIPQQLTCQMDDQPNGISFAEFRISDFSAPQDGDQRNYGCMPGLMQADAVVKTTHGTVAFSNTSSAELIRSVMEVMLHA